MPNIFVDARGLKDKEPFIKVRDALGLCSGDQMIDVLADYGFCAPLLFFFGRGF